MALIVYFLSLVFDSLLDTQEQSDENNDTQEENEPIAPIPDR